MKNTSIDKMADLRRDEIDGFLLKLNANNLIVISQNLNIDIKGETNKRSVLRLIQKQVLAMKEVLFTKTLKLDVLMVKKGKNTNFST